MDCGECYQMRGRMARKGSFAGKILISLQLWHYQTRGTKNYFHSRIVPNIPTTACKIKGPYIGPDIPGMIVGILPDFGKHHVMINTHRNLQPPPFHSLTWSELRIIGSRKSRGSSGIELSHTSHCSESKAVTFENLTTLWQIRPWITQSKLSMKQ